MGSECNLGIKYEKNGYMNITSVYYAKITIWIPKFGWYIICTEKQQKVQFLSKKQALMTVYIHFYWNTKGCLSQALWKYEVHRV